MYDINAFINTEQRLIGFWHLLMSYGTLLIQAEYHKQV